MVLAAMREAGVAAADTVVVGDTVYDIAMARAAGAGAIGVAWGYHAAAALNEAGASVVIDDFEALVPALDAIWS
jgi:phosphoglycolate phosphatase